MARQVIRQPDGRLAIFSTVVDGWVMYDATPDEVVEAFAEEAADSARHRARKVVEQVVAGNARSAYAQSTMSFEEADKLNAEHHPRIFDMS